MTKFKSLLAAFVLIPLASFGTTLTSDADLSIAQVGTPAVASELSGSSAQSCCWVFMFGNWYCFPC